MSEHEMTIGFIGNPNCGKTTLFNAYTGANLKVANWPGVTVEKVEGVMKDHDLTIHLVDLPGTYSLTSYTMEETVSRQFILSDEVDVIINVADASALERSLYLTLQLLDRSYESDIINQKYDFIGEIIGEVLLHKERQDLLTERADKLLTSKVWSIPIFLGIMAVTFFLTFTIGDWIKGYFELGIDWLSGVAQSGLTAVHDGTILTLLMVDGIIGGVGTIVTFLPNILIPFLCLALLEDSGYMARVAYVMEGIMSKLGLSGKAFIPMLLGFGCTVPAIMASRALENKRDRFKVMLVTPFMSCNARLTIYILFSEMFFGATPC